MTDVALDQPFDGQALEPRRLARAGVLLAGAAAASRGLGWLRLIIIAAIFGASPELDAYFAAFRIPDAVFQLLAGGVVASVLIPLIAERSRHSPHAAWRTVAGVANVLLVVLVALAGLAALAAPWLVPLIAPGFEGQQLALTVDMTRVMLLSPVCFLLGAVASSVLHSQGRFAATAAAPLIYNAAIIAAALALTAEWGVRGLALGVAAGAIGYLAVQLIPLVALTGYRHDPRAHLGEHGVPRALALLAPRSLGLAGAQLIFIVNTALATTLGPGAVTAYTLAFALLLVPLGVLGGPLAVVVFPSLAHAAARGADTEFRRALVTALRFTLWMAAFLTVVGIVLREHIVQLVFGHGQLDQSTLVVVAAVAMVLLSGIGAHSLNLVTARAFYAVGDTRTPVGFALGQVGLTLALALALVGPLGLPGLALAVAVGSWAKALLMLGVLARRRGFTAELPSFLRAAMAFALAGLGAGVVALGVAWTVDAIDVPAGLLRDGVVVTAGGALAGLAYLGLSQLLRLPEPGRALAIVRHALRPR